MNNEIKEVIEYHIENNMLLTVERNEVATGEIIIGFPFKLTDEILLMTVINDFHYEGYTIVNVCDITDAFSKESDEFYETICKSEGLNKIEVPDCLLNSINCTQVLDELRQYQGLVSVQCKEQYEREAFFLGKIMSLNGDELELLEIGMNGKWDENSEIIKISEIIRISFGDNYSKTYYKYVDDFNANI